METLKRFYGWQPDAADKDGLKTKRYKYAKFSFSNLKSAQNAVYFLERKGWSITDKLVKPLARFMNDKNLTPADWMHVSNAECLETKLQRISNCQLEFKCNIRDISSRPRDEIAPLLIMSFDGEMYSHDGAFPCVQKGDGTIYIGANFWTYGTPLSQTKKFMVCLGNVEKPLGAEDDIEYCCFSTKKEMLEAFRDLLVAADPDIVTSWNGFGFDFPFLDADYAAEFLKPHERGNESLQLLASALAKSIVFPSEHEEQQYSAAHYLAHIRSNKGPVETSRVIASAQRLCGYKAVAQLLKQEKDLKKATGNSHSLISSLHAHHEDSDDDETYESGGLEAHVASKLCGLLRNHCNGIDT
jgi:DNA polymerase elongation subunit (family B)